MTRLHLVRHGRASAGWNVDPDPGLDPIGAAQAETVARRLGQLAPCAIVASPMRRCQETAAPLAAAWSGTVVTEPRVGEIPSPLGVAMSDRVEWLRHAMAATWTELGERYTAYRDGVVRALLGLHGDTVVFSHFIAINAAIGHALGDDRVLIHRLDNCSVTVLEIEPGAGVVDGAGSGLGNRRLRLVEAGDEADTLIR